jgi:hypothetical protein
LPQFACTFGFWNFVHRYGTADITYGKGRTI